MRKVYSSGIKINGCVARVELMEVVDDECKDGAGKEHCS